MEIPDVPVVPIDLDDKTRDFLETLDDKLGLVEINAVKVNNYGVYVLGYKYNFLIIHEGIVLDRETGRVSEDTFTSFSFRLTSNFYRKIEEYKQDNLKDAEEKVKDIKIYQGTIEEVAKRLGRPLEAVDTHQPETFVRGCDSFMLRVKAHQFGGEAIVHYQNNPMRYNPHFCIGTPVKYADAKATNLKAA